MPPVKTQVSCPQCRQPVMVTLEQLFDVSQDPAAKARFINGRFNVINCPACRFQGQAATPVVYHDADKELLLTYMPMELGLPQPEQERIIGKLVNEIINKLPMEKRKGYLLSPKPALTLPSLVERVLEGEGVTREMMEAQRAKIQLIQQFLTTAPDQLAAQVKEHDAQIDAEFFELLAATAQATAASGSQTGAQRLLELQNQLVELSAFGGELKRRQQMVESAAQELQALGDQFTPDKLLELVLKADEVRATAYVSLARPAMDYAFFEALTRRIDRAPAEEKERLLKVRAALLKATEAVDKATQARLAEAARTLSALLESPDLDKALQDNAHLIDNTLMAVLDANLEAAQRAGRTDAVTRLTQLQEAIARLARESAPPEIKFINDLLDIEAEDTSLQVLRRRASEVSPGVLEAMTYLIDNLRQNNQFTLAERLERLRGAALEIQMAAQWKKA